MDKNLLDILKLLSNFGGQSSQNLNGQSVNVSSQSYPAEAYPKEPSNDNNLLPLLMSLLNKNGSLSEVFSLNNSSQKEPTKREGPNDEVLL